MKYGQQIASEYGFEVHELTLENRLRGFVILANTSKLIYVNDKDRLERQNFTVAHEIGHQVLEHPEGEETTWEHEQDANDFAANLLLDPVEVRSRAYEPLVDLKKDFLHCSHEVIARQCLKHREAVLTIFDDLHMTSRTNSILLGHDRKFPLQPLEDYVLKKCRSLKRQYRARNKDIECWANYIEDPPGSKVKRVVIFTESGGSQMSSSIGRDDQVDQDYPIEDESQEIDWDIPVMKDR